VLEVPHGIGSCVALLPGIRYHEPDTGVRQLALKRAVSWGDNVTSTSLYEAVAALLVRLQVPMHLEEIGVDGSRLDDVVAAMVDEAPWLGSAEQLRAVCAEMVFPR
jgi:alcohol dehydrogenase class IV